MSAGLAHEFKNAIATLHGYVQLLQSLELDEQSRGTASSLLNEVRNLSEMVTSFLNFARPQPLQLDEVNLDELIQDCAGELESLYKTLNVDLLIRRADASTERPQKIVIHADERMLRQTLLNLMRNAAEAIPIEQSSRKLKLLVRGRRVGRWSRLKTVAKEFQLQICSEFSFPSSPPRRPATEWASPSRIES